ncbi:UDP-glucose 4-epimerase GalE [Muricauda sp. SCSIO 64092]|uniref:UDP-glucose 4-epimerase GalE n=1 Tax=Allomuricauda sp. SCSIO 64092 TaxID=2908842 RepID=UPI001FF3CAAD|nr:UDP-glucose 4-epimerase GalE [Muricauda sp. SCSIO 64092]UOY04955.1 UDP-glucose 4-epimerase GalE [Muricauda sp. SCSIO 64092]
MKTKVLITGGTGYIGSHTAVTLIEAGYEVILIDNLSNSSENVVSRIGTITKVKPELEVIDLAKMEQCATVFKRHQDAKAIIHFAALKAVGESVKKPLEYYSNNIGSLTNTLICAKKNGIDKFIFSSSATVFGEPDSIPITEDALRKRPFSPYGNSKKVSEEIMEDLVASESAVSITSLRYFNPIGAHDSGELGELPSGVPNNLMPYITQTATGIREKLWVYGDDYPTRDGIPIRDYIHVVDLAEAHLSAMERLLKEENEEPMEVFNLGSGVGYSVMEVIHAFETTTGQKLNYEITHRRNGDVPQLVASSELAYKKLDWKPKRNLSEMVGSAWAWEKKIRNTKN